MRYNKLREVITEEGYSSEAFARCCGIEPGYFVRVLGSGDDFAPEEYWAMALRLGIAGSAEAQDELFFEDERSAEGAADEIC